MILWSSKSSNHNKISCSLINNSKPSKWDNANLITIFTTGPSSVTYKLKEFRCQHTPMSSEATSSVPCPSFLEQTAITINEKLDIENSCAGLWALEISFFKSLQLFNYSFATFTVTLFLILDYGITSVNITLTLFQKATMFFGISWHTLKHFTLPFCKKMSTGNYYLRSPSWPHWGIG